MSQFVPLTYKGEELPYLSVSQRGTLRRCPQKYEWAYMQGLRPERDANALWFGQLLHLSLAEWYLLGTKRGPHPAETFAALAGDEGRHIPTEYESDERKLVDAVELGVGMLEGYVLHYGKDPSQYWIATEQDFQVRVPPLGQTQLKKGQRPLTEFRGSIDGVYRDLNTEEIWLAEHKGFKDTSTGHLPMDDQGGSYLLFAERILRQKGLISKKETVVGVMYNILRKALPPKDSTVFDDEGYKLNKPKKEDFLAVLSDASDKSSLAALTALAAERGVTVLGSRSAGQPSPLFIREPTYRSRHEQLRKLEGIQREATYRDALVSGALPIFKNPTKDCNWDCQFKRMCQLHEAGEDWEDYRDAMFISREQAAAERLAREERKSV